MKGLSINTDIVFDAGSAVPYIRAATKHGFTHIHWCHHWADDYLYSDSAITNIRKALDRNKVVFSDCHATAGRKKVWFSSNETARHAGVELIKNRIAMTSQLGGDAVVLHTWGRSGDPEEIALRREVMKRSLKELEDYARSAKVKIALENQPTLGSFDLLEELFSEFDADYLGFCWDTGHSNMIEGGIERAAEFKDRLSVLHIHDNDGKRDQHKIPFSGTVDWNRVAEIIAESVYHKPLGLEVVKRGAKFWGIDRFLDEAFHSGMRLTEMVNQYRHNLLCKM